MILGFEDPDIADWMAMVYDSIRDREIDEVLASHFFTPDDVRLFGSDPQTVIERRTQRIVDEVHRFLDVQTGRDPDASAPAAPSPDDELEGFAEAMPWRVDERGRGGKRSGPP